jgi:hypothetical protein
LGFRYRIIGALAIVALALPSGCTKAKQPLTNEKVTELLEASSDFVPQIRDVTLTQDEIQKGNNAGYWEFSKQAEYHRENGQLIILTPQGRPYFLGTPPMRRPVISIKQKLGARLVEVTGIQPAPDDLDSNIATYTWTWKFENQIPELAEFFKDHPPEEGKKRFHYGSNGWEIQQ